MQWKRRNYTIIRVQLSFHLTLKPGESLIKHLTPTDAAFFVLEGKGIVQIGEERKEVDANTLIESPANVLHCWSNESSENLSFSC